METTLRRFGVRMVGESIPLALRRRLYSCDSRRVLTRTSKARRSRLGLAPFGDPPLSESVMGRLALGSRTHGDRSSIGRNGRYST